MGSELEHSIEAKNTRAERHERHKQRKTGRGTTAKLNLTEKFTGKK